MRRSKTEEAMRAAVHTHDWRRGRRAVDAVMSYDCASCGASTRHRARSRYQVLCGGCPASHGLLRIDDASDMIRMWGWRFTRDKFQCGACGARERGV